MINETDLTNNQKILIKEMLNNHHYTGNEILIHPNHVAIDTAYGWARDYILGITVNWEWICSECLYKNNKHQPTKWCIPEEKFSSLIIVKDLTQLVGLGKYKNSSGERIYNRFITIIQHNPEISDKYVL